MRVLAALFMLLNVLVVISALALMPAVNALTILAVSRTFFKNGRHVFTSDNVQSTIGIGYFISAASVVAESFSQQE